MHQTDVRSTSLHLLMYCVFLKRHYNQLEITVSHSGKKKQLNSEPFCKKLFFNDKNRGVISLTCHDLHKFIHLVLGVTVQAVVG